MPLPKPKKAGILQKMKSRVIDVASDAMSYPARRKSMRIQRQADFDTTTLKADRANKQAGYRFNPNEGDYTDPKFRTAVEAIHTKDRLKRSSNY